MEHSDYCLTFVVPLSIHSTIRNKKMLCALFLVCMLHEDIQGLKDGGIILLAVYSSTLSPNMSVFQCKWWRGGEPPSSGGTARFSQSKPGWVSKPRQPLIIM